MVLSSNYVLCNFYINVSCAPGKKWTLWKYKITKSQLHCFYHLNQRLSNFLKLISSKEQTISLHLSLWEFLTMSMGKGDRKRADELQN